MFKLLRDKDVHLYASFQMAVRVRVVLLTNSSGKKVLYFNTYIYESRTKQIENNTETEAFSL